MFKSYQMELAGRPLVIETGRYAELAGGAVMVRYGDTVILSTATARLSRERELISFL